MKIERYQPRSGTRSFWRLTCGCLSVGALGIVLTALAVMTFLPTISDVILSNIGLEVVGETDDIFNQPAPTVPVLENPRIVETLTLRGSTYAQTLTGEGIGYTVTLGESEGTSQIQIEYSEDGLLAQCRSLTPFCTSTNDEIIRNANFDLRPSGAVINGEFELSNGIWQPAGLVMQVSASNQMQIIGVEIGNRVYAPTDTDLSALVDQVEANTNAILRDFSVQTGPDTFLLREVLIDNGILTLILR
ncbi:MAG: hypothetical protein ACFE0Q_19875 [Anaerolineae bacterium]